MEYYDAGPLSTGSAADERLGVVLDPAEGRNIAQTLGAGKAIILQDHGLLTVGQSLRRLSIAMERSCQTELAARAAGDPRMIAPADAQKTRGQVGSPMAGWFSFQPLWQKIVRHEPDLLH